MSKADQHDNRQLVHAPDGSDKRNPDRAELKARHVALGVKSSENLWEILVQTYTGYPKQTAIDKYQREQQQI